MNLKKNGLIKKGIYLKAGEILIGKTIQEKIISIKIKLLNILFQKNLKRNNSLRIGSNYSGTIIDIKVQKTKSLGIIIYIVSKKRLKIGDKLSGRHGNKGIISKLIKNEEMPFLQDGTIIDIILNPLGIPSRMNLAQVLECLLGICGKILKEKYIINLFNKKQKIKYSIKTIYKKLNEIKSKNKYTWILNANNPGKVKILNAKTTKFFEEDITVGYSYIIKLIHMASEKITSRTQGSYSLITKQALKGKSKQGGQRIGEMEIWALEAFGCAYLLQETITLKSDDITNRFKILESLTEDTKLPIPDSPEALKVFLLEIKSICINIELYFKIKN